VAFSQAEISLRRDAQTAVKQEKERLWRELHDRLFQAMAGIVALSTTLTKRLRTNSRPAVTIMYRATLKRGPPRLN